MSATIMMPTQIESAIREMCTDAMSQAVAALAEKYGFDAEEANRFLSNSDVKIVRKRGPSPKKEKEGKKESKAKGDKPKRGKTGYLLYADEVRAEVKAELEAGLADGEKLKPQDVVKAIAARWKDEDKEVRDEWNAKAKTPVTSDDEAEPKAEAKAKAEPKAEAKAKTEAKNNPKPKADKKKAKEPEPEPEEVSDAESDEE